jgi:hypothetical protein
MKTQEEFSQATEITSSDYLKLVNPIFEGQTRVNEEAKYKMYWSSEGKMYYTVNKL